MKFTERIFGATRHRAWPILLAALAVLLFASPGLAAEAAEAGAGSDPIIYKILWGLTFAGSIVALIFAWKFFQGMKAADEAAGGSGPFTESASAVSSTRGSLQTQISNFDQMVDGVDPVNAPHNFTNTDDGQQELGNQLIFNWTLGGSGGDGAFPDFRTGFAALYTSYPGNAATDACEDLLSYLFNVAPGN